MARTSPAALAGDRLRDPAHALRSSAGLKGPMRISVLGATGSIGSSTLDLVGRTPELFEVVALTAQDNVQRLAEQAICHRARLAVIGDARHYEELKALLQGTGIEARAGEEAIVAAAAEAADCVMAAIVGAAGLRPTLEAVRQGRRVALANKECLVSAGEVFTAEVSARGCELIPVDSEHSAVFQAIGGTEPKAVEQIVLTASGGPFRLFDQERLGRVTPEEALKHPNWSMGAKITIDSATLMNKGLELIEAFHLFPVEPHQLAAIVHPQSIVHCLVTLKDGSVLAHLSEPDMRAPIAVALAWPSRMATPVERLDLVKLKSLSFEAPDEERFPCLRLAREALERGGAAPAVLNAANEIAVQAFLDRKIGFLDIATTVASCLEAGERRNLLNHLHSLEDVLEVDRETRIMARSVVKDCPG